MIIDATVTIGNIIAAGGMFLTGLWFVFRMETAIGLLRRDVKELEKDMLALAGAAIALARHDERFALFEIKIKDFEDRISLKIETQDERISQIWTAFNNWRIKEP